MPDQAFIFENYIWLFRVHIALVYSRISHQDRSCIHPHTLPIVVSSQPHVPAADMSYTGYIRRQPRGSRPRLPVMISFQPTTRSPYVYTCSAPQVWSASRMFAGGSMDGMNSNTTYARPMNPIIEPAMYRRTPSCSKIDPTKT